MGELAFETLLALWALKVGGSLGIIAALVWLYKRSKAFLGNPLAIDLRKHIKSPDYENRVCFRKQFHDDFANVVESYVGTEPVYVFIDDLDRCEVPRAADLMQSITLMLNNHPRLVFILGMDREKSLRVGRRNSRNSCHI